MEQLRDWPLSRQITWGIQLPVWYTKDGEAIITDGSEPENAAELTRDPDVFDTWFSSCQWPFSTLGNHSDDLKTFYPTTVIMPGYDILFFWVSRMMMLSIYTQGQTPYKVINLHGMVRDQDRQKMSKSKGNVIDPLGVVEEYGADALRLALLYGFAPGTDPTLSDEKIKGMRNFKTKMWNIARFVDLNTDTNTKPEYVAMTDADHAIHKQLQHTIKTVTQSLDAYDMHLALEALYAFVWNQFADVYLETAKEQLTNPAQKEATQGNLRFVLDGILKMSQPFMPFVTEAIWGHFYPDDANGLIRAVWPEVSA
jgi:valyl-tRNA synthetase